MNQFFEVNGKQYTLTFDYKDNEILRNSFNELTRKTYSFDLEQWYQDGYWKEQYRPYSILDGNKVVANVSVNIMEFLVLGIKKRYIQIGTVMTDQAYNGQGLNRVLMEKVISEWEDQCELIYLFANDSVLNYYPKFGFVPTEEYQFSKVVTKKYEQAIVRKIDVDRPEDRNLLFSVVSNSVPFAKITMLNNPYLILFYCTYFMKNCIYYLPDHDTIAIADIDGDTLFLHDVFSTQLHSLDKIIDALISEQIKKVVLGFVPEDVSSYEVTLLKEEDTTLFVKAIKGQLPKEIRFPLLSHA